MLFIVVVAMIIPWLCGFVLSGRVLLGHASEEYTVGFLVADDNPQLNVLQVLVPYAITKFNNNSVDVKLRLKTHTYDQSSLFGLVDAACSLLSSNPVVVISPDGSGCIASQADIFAPLHIPLLSIVATDPHIKKAHRQNLLLLSPGDEYQSRAILDLLSFYDWQEMAFVASDSTYGINGVTYFQTLLTNNRNSHFVVKSIAFFNAVTHFNHLDPEQMRTTLINTKRSLARVIILNCEGQYGRMVLQEAYKMGLMGPGYVWIVTEGITANPKLLAFDGFYPSYYEGLLGIGPSIDSKTLEYKAFVDRFVSSHAGIDNSDISPTIVKSYDAVQLAGRALNLNIVPPAVNCSTNMSWLDGESYLDAIKSTKDKAGASGRISFTSDGLVKVADYKIVNFVNPGFFVDVGNWSSIQNRRLNMFADKHAVGPSAVQFLGSVTHHPIGIPNLLSGVHLRIGVTENSPFASWKEGCVEPPCWEGITPDTVVSLAGHLNFTYEFIEPADKLFGNFDEVTEEWDGLIGDMLDAKTDLIAMDLSVSFERKSHIEFTSPFMDSGIRLAVRGDSGKDNLFFFLSPFSSQIWFMIGVALLIMALIQNLFNKLSPFGEYGRRVHATQVCPCETCVEKRQLKHSKHVSFRNQSDCECLVEQAEEKASSGMSLYNSIWVVGGGFVGQGGDALPASPSGRFILFTWWFFVMLITSMYTANLTAFMTLDKIGIELEDMDDLLTQSKYTWGMINQSFVESLLRNNIDPIYGRIAAGAAKFSSVEEGKEKIMNEKFVFIDEAPALSYHIMGECDVFYVGEEFQKFDYAFGVPKNSPYVRLLNVQLVKLREEGYFERIWLKWDKTPDTGGCKKGSMGKDEILDFTTIKGIFLFLFLGTLVSVVLIILEVMVVTINDEYDPGHRTIWAKLCRRFRLKLEDIRTEWFDFKITKTKSSGKKYNSIKSYSLKRFDSQSVKI